MSELSERGKAFQKAIADFIEQRRLAKERERKSYDPASYEYSAWLENAARKVSQIQVATHILKATHPDASGTNLYVIPTQLPAVREIGSHTLGDYFAEDVVGNAAALDVFKFLMIKVEEKPLLHWFRNDDSDLLSALCDDEAKAAKWAEDFSSLIREVSEPVSHSLAKQVYWLAGEDPRNDDDYHLLQPMFSSSLAHAIHSEIHEAVSGKANRDARDALKNKKPSELSYRDYRGISYRKFGGTKPQNISQLNSERLGRNYLFSSLPPKGWMTSTHNILRKQSAFDEFLYFGRVRELIKSLVSLLSENPKPNIETRSYREELEVALGEELALFGVSIRAQYPAGWTRDPACRLPYHQRLWLDPERTALPMSQDSGQQVDDENFNRDYSLGGWADRVAEDFGLWLNNQLRQRSDELLTLGEVEMRHFARQAVIDVAWPEPIQRSAVGG